MVQDILIKNGFIVTMNKERKIFSKGDIYVVEDKIVDIDENLSISDPEFTVDAHNHLIMPGFVNSHSHLQQ